jgi:NADH:ubiquinone oxidoreductase subunit
MLSFLARIFTWWNGTTFGTQWTLLTRGARKIGTDEFGNRYFEEPKPSLEGRKRRYVIYNGYADASRVPSDWHGWLHHTFDIPPSEEPLLRRAWELDHKPNLTGTVHAYRPAGSLARGGERQKQAGDYEAWSPDQN